MIKTKDDLREYLQCDKMHLGIKHARSRWNNDIWKYEIALRRHEYYHNNRKGIINRFLCKYWAWRHHRLGVRLGFTIYVNTCGKGLRLSHYGSIIINGKARLGDFCDLHSCVNIGQNGGKENSINTPTIGDRVWIGLGAKLFGKITITDGCQIGANAIVNKSFDTPGSVIAGCPAKVLKVLPIYVSAD